MFSEEEITGTHFDFNIKFGPKMIFLKEESSFLQICINIKFSSEDYVQNKNKNKYFVRKSMTLRI